MPRRCGSPRANGCAWRRRTAIAASFARRIARNTQLLLLEESHVGRVLDPAGGSWFVEDLTEQLAQQLEDWRMSGDNYSLLIGGPDGLSPECLQRADLRWSLSDLTLPHPLVRRMAG